MFKIHSFIFTLLTGGSLWFFSATIHATERLADDEQPVHITADSLIAQEKKGLSLYKGNVVVTQGSLVLQGDIITVEHPNGELKTLKATGKPARFKRFDPVEQSWLKGNANLIYYHADQKTVLLTGNAQVEEPGKHVITGPKLFYDIGKKTLQAQATKQEKGRVSVTLNPSSNNASNKPVKPQ